MDVFDSIVVVQSSAIWVELHKEMIKEALVGVMGTDAKLIWRQALSRLNQDGLGEIKGFSENLMVDNKESKDEAQKEMPIVVLENNIKYEIQPEDGQKTGFYCDQRDNRQFVRNISEGKDVLDTYCYSGGFSISAALGGAERVVAVDSSAAAISAALTNLELNDAPIQA